MTHSRHQRKKHMRFTIIISFLTFLLIAASIGFGFKVEHDAQVRKEKIAAYQKLKVSAQSAETLAYKEPTDANFKKAQDLVNQLEKTDQKPIQEKLTQLDVYLKQIDSAKDAINQYAQAKTPASLTAAQNAINLLTSDYEKTQKTTLLQQLANTKKKVEDEQAAAAKKAAAEQAKKEAAEFKNKKLVALTFDDGPNPITTPTLLAELKAANVKVTFFALGEEAQAYPNVIKAEAADGHEVASHTWDHKDLTTLSPAAQNQEIMSAHDLINSLSGQQTTIYRPPYGSYNDTTLAASPLSPVLWSADTNDWKYVGNTPIVVQNAVSSAHDGAIILLHDIDSWSVAAVPSIISQLKAQGYTFVTVSQMMAARPAGTVHNGKVYTGY